MAQDAVTIVSQVYQRAGARDWDGAEELLSDDLVIHEAASVPFGGEWRGKDALRRLFATVMPYWIDPQVEIDAIVGDDRHAVVLLRFTMTSRHSGRRFTQHVNEVSIVENGLVVEMRVQYFDTAEIAAEAVAAG